MRKLSTLDAGFVYCESPETPCHIGAVQIFADPATGSGDFHARVKDRIAARLDAAAPYRWRLKPTPLGLDHPVWEEGDDPDLDAHVFSIKLTGDGSPERLAELCAKLQSQPLDPAKPMFEYYVIEGLRGGHTALLSKLHHSFIDGASGTALTLALYDMDPAMASAVAAPPGVKGEKVSTLDVAAAALANLAAQPLARASAALGLLDGALGFAGKLWKREAGLPTLPFAAPRTRFNAMVGRDRSYAAFSLAQSDFKAMRAGSGATLNDLALAICGGALRRYLLARGELPAKSLTAMAPVSLRGKGDSAFATKVTAMFAELATDEPEPLSRLARVRASAKNGKAGAEALRAAQGADVTALGLPAAAQALLGAFAWARGADYLPPICNVTISNVPSAPFPLFIDGRQMVANYPISIVAHGAGLNVTLQSYDGALDFGITACRKALPDPERLVEALVAEASELKRAILGDARLARVERLDSFAAPAAAAPIELKPRARRAAKPAVPLAERAPANLLAAE